MKLLNKSVNNVDPNTVLSLVYVSDIGQDSLHKINHLHFTNISDSTKSLYCALVD